LILRDFSKLVENGTTERNEALNMIIQSCRK